MASPEINCRAVLFDCDGVLVDSRSAGEAAWNSWAKEMDLDADLVRDGLHGRRSQDTVGLFVPAPARAGALALIEGIELAGATATRPIPGAVDLVTRLAGRCAVVTSASTPLVTARLVAAGFPPPEVIVSGTDVEAGKPAPDGYLLAAARLGVPIGNCAVIEDSGPGAAAAYAAGAAGVVVVGGDIHPRDGDLAVPDLRGIRWTGHSLVATPPDRTLSKGRPCS